MPTYIIVKAVDGWDTEDKMVYQTGDPVDVFNRSVLNHDANPQKFCEFCITDEDDFEAIKAAYNKEWRKEIDWEFVGHNYALDGHRLKVFMISNVVSTSGLNSLTKSQVEQWLNKWNCSIYSTAVNEVVFDAVVFDVICSSGFWDNKDVSNISFSEIDYDKTLGVHSIEADYSSVSIDPLLVEQIIQDKGGVITSHPTGKVKFDITRGVVFSVFKIAVKDAIESETYSRRQFKVPSKYVQMALDAGGTLNITRKQFATYIYNRLND